MTQQDYEQKKNEVKPTESGRFGPKPARPFKVGDKVKFPRNADEDLDGTIVHELPLEPAYIVVTEDGKGYTVFEHDLEPYIEPTDLNKSPETCTDDCSSQDFDGIIKDGFREHNRLHIAAMLAAGILANRKLTEWQDIDRETHPKIVKASLRYADALIAEAQKGGGE